MNVLFLSSVARIIPWQPVGGTKGALNIRAPQFNLFNTVDVILQIQMKNTFNSIIKTMRNHMLNILYINDCLKQ